MLANAEESGVTRFMVPGISVKSSVRAAELSEIYHGIYAAAGIHPNEIESPCDFDDIPEILLNPGVIAVGETGLDLYHDRIPVELQIEYFKKHISLAEAFGLTLIVHSRSAEREVLDVLGDDVAVPVIMHCYTGPDTIAREAASRGYYVGFAGPLSFKKNGRLRDLAGSLPADRILIETDAPYLSPEPVRGKRNEPSNVKYIAGILSQIWGTNPEDTSEILLSNSLKALQMAHPRRTDLAYRMYGNIYMNITDRCTNSCMFCIKDRTDGIGGYHLKHHGEPDGKQLESIIEQLQPGMGNELVFCGYGEPTMRPELLKRLAERASEKGFPVRLNTNGTCLERLSLEKTVELLEPFDSVSVSLNASCKDEYNGICRPSEETAWESLMKFIELAVKSASVKLTAVSYPGLDIESVAKLAASLNLPFRARG